MSIRDRAHAFQNPSDAGMAGANVVLNGLPSVSFTQYGRGSASYDGGLLNNRLPRVEIHYTAERLRAGLSDGGWQQPTARQGGRREPGRIDVTTVLSGQSLNGFVSFTSADRFEGVRVVAGPSPGGSLDRTNG